MYKRLISILLAVCLLATAAPMAFAAEERIVHIMASGVIGQVTYPSLESALGAAVSGDTVTLLDYDSSLTEPVTVPKGVVLKIQSDKILRLREEGRITVQGRVDIEGGLSVGGTGLLDVQAGTAICRGTFHAATRDNVRGVVYLDEGGRALSDDNIYPFLSCARASDGGKTWSNMTFANSWVHDEGAVLTGLTLSTGTLSPVFSPDVTVYDTTVENGTSRIWLIPSCLSGHSITVNNKAVQSGSRTDYIDLAVGTNVINIRVMNGNGSQAVRYELRVTRKEYVPLNFKVNVEAMSHGKVVASPDRAEEGDQVTLTAVPDAGYKLQGIVAVSNGKSVDLVSTGNGTFGFIMPRGDVTVDAEFAKAPIRFDDVKPGQWFYDHVNHAADNGWISGIGNGLFAPNDSMRRGDFCIMMARIDGANLDGYHASRFSDVPDGSYYMKAIAYCADRGYVSGVGKGRFAPNETITREQMAKIIASAKGIKPDAHPVKKFNDDAEISDWARDYIYGCLNARILVGDNAGNVNPGQPAKRAEAAAMLVRAFG